MLFDLLRPTLDLTGPHAELDLRRLKNWKRDDRRDGRSLLPAGRYPLWIARPWRARRRS